jgi:hypothetical protein
MAILRATLAVLLVVAVTGPVAGQEKPVEVAAAAGMRTIAVGDTFRVDIDLKWREGVNVKPLALGENLGDFAVRDITYGPVTLDDSLSTRVISLLLTVFETGSLTVPPVQVVYMDVNGEAGRVETPALEIEVESILPEDAEDIKDIKAPIEVPKRWADIIGGWALLIGLALAASASVLVSMKRREDLERVLRRLWHRLSAPFVRLVRLLLMRLRLIGRDEYGAPAYDGGIAEPYLTPEEAAFREFDRIDAMNLPEQGRAEELGTLVSEAVRRYLERRYRILAMESPTSYTIEAIRAMDVPSGTLGLIQELLEETDLVKFARFRPEEEATLTLTDRGRRMVRETGSKTPAVSSGEGAEA